MSDDDNQQYLKKSFKCQIWNWNSYADIKIDKPRQWVLIHWINGGEVWNGKQKYTAVSGNLDTITNIVTIIWMSRQSNAWVHIYCIPSVWVNNCRRITRSKNIAYNSCLSDTDNSFFKQHMGLHLQNSHLGAVFKNGHWQTMAVLLWNLLRRQTYIYV